MEYIRRIEKYHHEMIIEPLSDSAVEDECKKVIEQQTQDNVLPIFTFSEFSKRTANTVELCGIPSAQVMPNHCHDYYEINYVISGVCFQYIHGKLYRMEAGDMILLPPSTFHTLYTSRDTIADNILLRFDFLEEFIRQYALQVKKSFIEDLTTAKAGFYLFHNEENSRVCKLLTLFHTFLTPLTDNLSLIGAYRHDLMKSLLFELLIGMNNDALRYETDREPTAVKATHADVQQYICSHLATINQEELKRRFGFSRMGLNRFMKSMTGGTYTTYVGKVRISHACYLLINSDMPIAEIATGLGFQSGECFCRFFKAQKHVSPTLYRKYGGEEVYKHI